VCKQKTRAAWQISVHWKSPNPEIVESSLAQNAETASENNARITTGENGKVIFNWKVRSLTKSHRWPDSHSIKLRLKRLFHREKCGPSKQMPNVQSQPRSRLARGVRKHDT